MSNLQTSLWSALDTLRDLVNPGDALLAVATALYQVASEYDPLLPTAPMTPTRATHDAFWRAQANFRPLALSADWQQSRRDDALNEALLERLRAAVLNHSLDHRTPHLTLDLGAALTELIDQHTQQAGGSGLIPTPPSVAALCAELTGVQAGMHVLDPAAGVGRTVVALAHHLRQQGVDSNTVQFDLQEVNVTSATLAETHLLLNGIRNARIWLADTLQNRQFPLNHYDRVVTDPPFGLKLQHLNIDPADARFLDIDLQRFKTRSEWLFLLTALAALKPGGHAIAITAVGLLFRGGVEEDLRRTLSRRGALEAVINLPSSLYAVTGISLALLKFRRPVPGETPPTSVRLLDASRDATRVARQQVLSEAARSQILQDLQLDTHLTERAITISVDSLTESGNWIPGTHLPVQATGYDLPQDYDQQLRDAQQRLARATQATQEVFARLTDVPRT